ncbi:MAG: metallophosphoesterase, partial [Clostridia bacterium]|nr:metallophosphoesterase [Clostridia bacterium]
MKRALSLIVAIVMLCSSLVMAPVTVAADDPVVTRFAVVSDVHTNPVSPATTIDRLPKVFETAYAYAESQGGKIDAFIFNGDSINGNETSKGYTNEDEMGIFLKGIKDNVKEGSKVLLAMARTHDIYDGDGNIYYVQESELNALIAEHLGTDGSIIPTADWGYAPHLTMVGGVPVITLTNDIGNGNAVNTEDDGNAGNDDNADNSYHDSEAWLDTQLAALTAENPERAIFVVFHYPEVGKLGWTQRWGQNSLRDTLNKYPQVIAVNAHVHWDPRMTDSITQDRFTEVYDGAVRNASGWAAESAMPSYSVIEVTESGAVTIRYIDPETGDFLQEANGSGETLTYSIPKAWDRSTYLYTDEQKFAVDEAAFAADASIKLQNGTLTFDRAESEHPVLRYNVAVHDGKVTKTYTVSGDYLGETLPATFSTKLALKTGIDYTITVTAVDGLFRESANALVLTGNINDPEKVLSGTATAVAEKTYGGNGTKGEYDYPDFKTYATTPDAEGITNWGISDAEDLAVWSDFSKTNNCLGLTFHLENDIDMKDEIFNMIGSLYVPFKGTFDGHLHTLSNLFISDTSGMGTGFFVYAVDATIRNFGIKNGQVYGHVSNRKYENAGTYSLSGSKRTAFTDVIGVAAIAGRADNTDFTHVWNGADVSFHADKMEGFANPCIAGLVGRAQSNCTFVGCYNTGDVHGLDRASGFANWAQNGTYIAQISNCFNLGAITTETGASTEAIARYNTVNTADLSYFNYNNYYLEGSADIATNRASDTGYTANGAEEAIVLTAEEVQSDLADLLNANRFNGLYADTATWATGEDGVPYIVSVDDSGAGDIYPFSTYAADSTHTYYSINSLEEFTAFATASATDQFEGKVISLNVDLDLSSLGNFSMIGTDTYSFKGTFNGKGHTISNMTTSSGATRGLFRDIEAPGVVKNFTLKDATVNATQNCGMVTAKLTGGTVENVTVLGGTMTITSNNNFGGIAGATAGTALSTVKNCTVNGLTMNGASRQGLGGIIGNSAYITVDGCKVINCTITGNRSNGLLGGFVYHGSTFKNCVTYGNTFRSNFNTYGLVGRGGNKNGTDNLITVENCVFYETEMTTTTITDNTSDGKARTENFVLFRYSDTENIVTNNVYTASPEDSPITAADVIHTNATELASGKIAYDLGWTMKDGYVALPEKGDEATHCYTYVMGETTEYRYTDASGAVINGAPADSSETFLGWTVTAGAKEGDLVYTATYGTEDNGTYPITEFENRPKATKFTVSTPEELNVLAALSKTHTFEGRTITLLNDIDMSGTENFAMIGSESCRFTANFDGGNHTIYNVTINNTNTYTAFFSMTGVDKTKNVTIKNLTLEDASVNGGESSAILIGKAYGVTTLENVKLRYSTVIS